MGKFIVTQKSLIIFNRKLLLIQRSSKYKDEGEWEFVGGCLEFGENLLAGLMREIKEEVGLAVRVDKLLYAGTMLWNPQVQGVYLTYLSYADTDKVTLSNEHKDFLWATRTQLMDLLNKAMLDDLISNSVLEMLDIDL